MKSVFEELTAEIRTGPFSILSKGAQDRLCLLINLAMADGYERGVKEGIATSLISTITVCD